MNSGLASAQGLPALVIKGPRLTHWGLMIQDWDPLCDGYTAQEWGPLDLTLYPSLLSAQLLEMGVSVVRTHSLQSWGGHCFLCGAPDLKTMSSFWRGGHGPYAALSSPLEWLGVGEFPHVTVAPGGWGCGTLAPCLAQSCSSFLGLRRAR